MNGKISTEVLRSGSASEIISTLPLREPKTLPLSEHKKKIK